MHEARWTYRLKSFKKALIQLSKAVALSKQRKLSLLEEQGTIQAFEFTHELAWKLLKDFLEDKSGQKLYGSKDATKAAFEAELITDGETWMEMISSRNLTSHVYDEQASSAIFKSIIDSYYNLFTELENKMTELYEQNND